VYAVIRLTPAGGGLTPLKVSLDSIYAVILGGAILIITTMLRAAATSVDQAQATALEGYAHAVRAHAMEAERVRVDAIVHDSVLTTCSTRPGPTPRRRSGSPRPWRAMPSAT
jgi:hypothetical protein